MIDHVALISDSVLSCIIVFKIPGLLCFGENTWFHSFQTLDRKCTMILEECHPIPSRSYSSSWAFWQGISGLLDRSGELHSSEGFVLTGGGGAGDDGG